MCNSCQMIRINGIVCHETGCPDAWEDEVRECLECGSKFTPETKRDKFCSDECYLAYNGLLDEFQMNDIGG